MDIQVEFSKIKRKMSFKNIDELQKWINNERDFWNWLDIQSDNPQIKQIIKHIKASFSDVESKMNLALQNRNSKNSDDFLNGAIAMIIQRYDGKSLLLSDQPEAKFINTLKSEDPEIAACALAFFIGANINISNKTSFEGFIRAFLFTHGIDKFDNYIESERDAIADLKKKTEEELLKYSAEFEKKDIRFDGLIGDIETKRNEQQTNFVELISKSEKELSNIELTYSDKLALQSSISYWTTKEVFHKEKTGFFMKSSFAVITALAVVLIGLSFFIFTETEHPPYWKFSMFIIIAVLGVWIARIIVRIFFSHLHLETDAKERVTMINTYLALLREQQGLKEEDKQLILQTLFRPGNTGIIKDDGIPPSVLDLISRISKAN